MKCVIIAGGKGTRLGLSDIPKPMARVGGIPVIEHQVALARRYGYTDIIILAGHLAEVIVGHLGDGSRLGVHIEYIVEKEPLGTGGALRALMGRVDSDFLVFYGDVFVDMNLHLLDQFHRKGRSTHSPAAGETGDIAAPPAPDLPAAGTLVVHPNSHPHDSDLVEAADDGRIRAFHPKPHPEGSCYRNLVNAALYILSPEVLAHIPADRPSDLGRELFPALLADGKLLRAYSTPEYLKDMGTPERLAAVDRDFLHGKPARRNLEREQQCIFLDRDGIINREAGGVLRAEDFELREEIIEALKGINESDFLAVVVTNQPFIAKGQLTAAELDRIHARMDTLLGAQGVYLDALYYCPHHPEKGWPGEIAELKVECDCRKPEPGMILRAAGALHIDTGSSWIIGDHLRDTLAGKNAGLRGSIFVGAAEAAEAQANTLRRALPEDDGPAANWYDHRFDSVLEAVRFILEEHE